MFLNDTHTFAGGEWTTTKSHQQPAASVRGRGDLRPRAGQYGRRVRRCIPENRKQRGVLHGAVRHVGLERCHLAGDRHDSRAVDCAGPCLEYPNMVWDVRAGGLLVTGGYTLVDGREYPNQRCGVQLRQSNVRHLVEGYGSN